MGIADTLNMLLTELGEYGVNPEDIKLVGVDSRADYKLRCAIKHLFGQAFDYLPDMHGKGRIAFNGMIITESVPVAEQGGLIPSRDTVG